MDAIASHTDRIDYASHDLEYLRIADEFFSKTEKRLADDSTRKIDFSCSVKAEQGHLLYDLVREAKPENTFETGLAWGGSAIPILAALNANQKGRHVAIDPFQASWSNIGVLETRRLGLADRFECLYERSDVALPKFVAEGRRFQFAFLDGDHRFDGVFIDFYYSQKLLDVGGIMMFDDIQGDGIARALAFVKANMPNLQQMDVPSMGRFATFRKVGEDERTEGGSHPF